MIFRISLFLLSIECLSGNLYAQEVIATDGSYSLNSQGSLSWTLGEVITETFSTTDNFLTQGFQQKLNGFLSVGNELLIDELSIYPNPFTSNITLIPFCSDSEYLIKIYDSQNKIVFDKNFLYSAPCEKLNIDLSILPAGVYFFTITSPSTDKKFFERIIKLK